MIGEVFLMELRTGWKGLFVFLIIAILLGGGMVLMFPGYKESFKEDLEGMEKLDINVPEEQGGNISLSWDEINGAVEYYIYESNKSLIIPPTRVFNTSNTSINIPYDFDEKRYYVVLAITNTSLEIPIGMTTTETIGSPFDDMLSDSGYQALTGGGKVTTILELRGFISLEFFSWWIFLAGLFFAYISVSSIASDFEGNRMDLIFSTPLSREWYLIEKFIFFVVSTFFILLFIAGAMVGATSAIGYLDELDSSTMLLAIIGSLPMLMVVQSIGFLSAVQFRSTKVGMGIAFLFILVEFVLFTAANMSASIESAKYATIMQYWDYNTVLYDGLFKVGDFIGLFVVAGLILGLAIVVFKKKDIPA
jgi:ABC-type transport system involved in multi-copper enzyme maturation permease subunit